MIKRLMLGLGILGAGWLPNAYGAESPPLPLGIVFTADNTQPLAAQPQPNIAPPQTSALTDRDYILSLISERDRLYSQRFDAQEKATASALTAAREATQKADLATEKRFDSVNEFRSTLKDQQANLMLKSEAEVKFKSLEERISQNAALLAQSRGQAEGQSWLWGVIVGGVGLLVGIGMLVINLMRPHRAA